MGRLLKLKLFTDGRDKPLVDSIPALTRDFLIIDLPRRYAAKHRPNELGTLLVLSKIDAPQTGAAHATKAFGQPLELVIHGLECQQAVLLIADVPGVEDTAHRAYELVPLDEGLLRELRD